MANKAYHHEGFENHREERGLESMKDRCGTFKPFSSFSKSTQEKILKAIEEVKQETKKAPSK